MAFQAEAQKVLALRVIAKEQNRVSEREKRDESREVRVVRVVNVVRAVCGVRCCCPCFETSFLT